MDYLKFANSWWMYLLGAIVTVYVLAGSIFFIVKAFKDAQKFNMDINILKKTIFNSAVFTILPSIGILIGVIALSGSLGIPLPWIRLTVIGALHYEGAAVEAVMDSFKATSMNTAVFVTVAFAMTLGILTGPLYCLFGFKAYDKKLLAKTRDNDLDSVEEVKKEEKEVVLEKPKKKFGDVLFNAVFIAMIASFLAVDFAKLADGDYSVPLESYTPTVVIVVSFLSMFIFDVLEKKLKLKWLSSFSLGFSMLIGMAVAVLLG